MAAPSACPRATAAAPPGPRATGSGPPTRPRAAPRPTPPPRWAAAGSPRRRRWSRTRCAAAAARPPPTSLTSWNVCSMAPRSASTSRIASAVTPGSVHKYARPPSSSRTSTTRITPPAGRQVARKVLIVLATRAPYGAHSTVRQPRRCPARLARSILSWPSVGSGPRCPGRRRAGGPQGGVGAAAVGGAAGGPKPAGDGAAAAGEAGAAPQPPQAPGGAAVAGGDDLGKPGGQNGGEVREGHGRLLGRTRVGIHPASGPGRRPSSRCASASWLATPVTADQGRQTLIQRKSRKVQSVMNPR